MPDYLCEQRMRIRHVLKGAADDDHVRLCREEAFGDGPMEAELFVLEFGAADVHEIRLLDDVPGAGRQPAQESTVLEIGASQAAAKIQDRQPAGMSGGGELQAGEESPAVLDFLEEHAVALVGGFASFHLEDGGAALLDDMSGIIAFAGGFGGLPCGVIPLPDFGVLRPPVTLQKGTPRQHTSVPEPAPGRPAAAGRRPRVGSRISHGRARQRRQFG